MAVPRVLYRVEHRFGGAVRSGDKPALAAEVTKTITSGARARSEAAVLTHAWKRLLKKYF